MLKHIVFWTLQDRALGKSAADNAREIQRRLESLRGRIPGMRVLEVGFDVSRTSQSADVALYSEFDDAAALDAYLTHPEHVAAADFIGEVRASRSVVDYEV